MAKLQMKRRNEGSAGLTFLTFHHNWRRVLRVKICSLRNKIEELKRLQLICKCEILAVTETHLDKICFGHGTANRWDEVFTP